MSRTNNPDPNPALAALRKQLADVCTRDYGRLFGRCRQLSRARDVDTAGVDALRRDMAASVARRDARAVSKPPLSVPTDLPISAHADDIIALIRKHQVIVVAGETGSGKTTQLPKLCLAAGQGEAGMIGCTQPRRLAARTVARRVAEEMGTDIGAKVGFQVRFTEQVSDATLVKFMTDGIALAETQSDPWLSAYDTLIIDEAHERSLNIDFLLGYLKRLLARRRNLKVIVTSATIDTARFAAHFDGAPVVEVEGRAYPVEVRWRPIGRNGGQSPFSTADSLPAPKSRASKKDSDPTQGGVPAPTSRVSKKDSDPTQGGVPAPKSRASKKDSDPMQGAMQGGLPAPTSRASKKDSDPTQRGVQQGSPEHIVRAIDEIGADEPRADVLVFLPGEREIRDTHLALSRRQYRHTEILPLYARLSANDQDRVFKPGPLRRIVLATNVAETSLTVPRIRCVVDTGTARVMRYSRRSQIERLHVEPVSQAAADQRKGRCGRVGPGVCIRLYGEEDYTGRPRFTDPELLRSSLANVILRMLSLKLGDVSDFPFLDAPDPRAIADGYRRLAEVSAIDDAHRLTATGRELARLPIDVQLARMLVEAQRLDVLREALIVVAFLSVQDPRERPADARQQADAAHREWADATSDFVTVLKLWDAFIEASRELGRSKLRDWCSRHFLGYLRLREWREVHRQLKLAMPHDSAPGSRDAKTAKGSQTSFRRKPESIVRRAKDNMDSGFRRNDDEAGCAESRVPTAGNDKTSAKAYEALHCSLLSGLPTQVARKDEHGVFRGTRERKFQVFPGSALAKAPPNWIFAAQILDIGGKVWGMQCARIEPRWVERQAAHLTRSTCRDPHWSRKRGAVVAYEQVTLFGLVLVERRAVTFRKQDPELAHQVFVREALACCEIDARAEFVRANARVLAQAHDIEARQRRQDLIRPDEELARFFEGKLPKDMADSRALDAWYRKAPPAQQAALRWSLTDVMAVDDRLDKNAFPSALELAGQHYRLSYRFVPGDDADGVTVHVPLSLLNAMPAACCQWLVPGLLADKAAALIRGLPKAWRRNFVPAPDFARAFTEAEARSDAPLAQVLARFLTRTTGVVLAADAFAGVELPPHLTMRFALEDGDGKPLAASRDLQALRAQWKGQARAAFSRQANVPLERSDTQSWDFDDIPARIEAAGKPDAFPALVDQGSSVALRVFERNQDARTEHARGVERLLRLGLEGPFKRARKQLPIAKSLALQYAPLGTLGSLREDLVEGGFADLIGERDLQVRTRGDYEALHDAIARHLFGAAVARLQLAEPVIAAQAEARRWLRPPRAGQAPGSYADLAEQLEHLLAPGFLRDVTATRLAHYPRYLQAMQRRAERLQRDPGKDHRHLQQLLPYWRAWLEHHAAGETSPELEHLRWLIEEWRVSLFAQELKTAEPVSAKRLQRALDAL